MPRNLDKKKLVDNEKLHWRLELKTLREKKKLQYWQLKTNQLAQTHLKLKIWTKKLTVNTGL